MTEDEAEKIGVLLTDMTPEQLAMEVLRLRRDCGEAYQAVGGMADALGWWRMPPDHPWHRPIEKLLDNLSAAADGDPREHDDLLPFFLGDHVEEGDRLTAAARAFAVKLIECHKDKAYQSVWQINQLHAGPYCGPRYAAEFRALCEALGIDEDTGEGLSQ